MEGPQALTKALTFAAAFKNLGGPDAFVVPEGGQGLVEPVATSTP